jgi:succinylarginine dihydrolase
MKLTEVQVDRMVGPTHHFGGLGVGNLASQQHAGHVSNPVAAALQGLDKMRLVASLGVPQLILPPQPRPEYQFLRALGFAGSDSDVLRRASDEAPHLLSAATSCSAMWTANAGTVTAAVDSRVDRVNSATTLTVANLSASVHRAIEPRQTCFDLRRVLPAACCLFEPLPGGSAIRDEGAANHMRLGTGDDRPGINIFVYGDGDPAPESTWPRQSRTAFEAIARRHCLRAENTFFLKQHPDAIDAGAFHNDVVAISHHDLLIHHELAFFDDEATLARIENRFCELTGMPLTRIEVPERSLSISDAVKTYLFNSQVVSPVSNDVAKPDIICTSQVERHPSASALVKQWCEDGLFGAVHFVDLDQSMSGGGGPACLRLRVPVTDAEAKSIPANVRWTEAIDAQLRDNIQQHYVSRLTMDDLARIEFHAHAGQATQSVEETLTGSAN